MTDFINKTIAWIKANWIIAIFGGIAVIILFFPRLLRGLFGGRPRRRRRTVNTFVPRSRGRRYKPAVQRSKNGRVKKPWQIKGSEAARRHMAKIRRMR